jgi:hypothetical protein
MNSIKLLSYDKKNFSRKQELQPYLHLKSDLSGARARLIYQFGTKLEG